MKRLLFACLMLSVPLGGCSEDVAPTALLLEVTADAPASGARIDTLRVLLASGDVRWPATADAAEANFALGDDLDPTARPVYLEIAASGATFADPRVTARVAGFAGGVLVAAWEGPLELGTIGTVKAHLTALTDACDVDRDGFADCTVDACCGADAASPFADCEPTAGDANPWGVEDACEPCDDVVDQDCDGGDAPCVDEDGDGVADCAETDCGAGDPNVAPGLDEVCDEIDNDCDGETDEGFGYVEEGQTLAIGADCGLGACAGGEVICVDAATSACSSAGRAKPESCGNDADDDCDGATDEGCGGSDLDGDGFTEDNGDCNDRDAGFFVGAPEPCCAPDVAAGPDAVALCDRNCDGAVTACAPGDGDGDGWPTPADCDDTDPLVNPDMPEKCGDGVDQDCFGGDQACGAGLTDADGDGWSPPADCNDSDATVHPAAVEGCDGVDEDCDGLTDEGNPGGDEPCGSDLGLCTPGVTFCLGAQGALECQGADGPTDEVCDGQDNDCDGLTDDGFTYGGAAVGAACLGAGACGLGVVECATAAEATCSTMPNGSAPQAAGEVCDGVDNDCDGETDEGLTAADSDCSKAGVCGAGFAAVVATCDPATGTWSCDYGAVPDYTAGSEAACDKLDNDCDGFTDEDFGTGVGCDGDDPDTCANGVVVCLPDGVGTTCDESAGSGNEVCDGLDNDCDGETDEDFPTLGQPCDGPDSDFCANGVFECAPDASGVACLTETATSIAEVCDGEDNDCDSQTDEGFVYDGGPYVSDAGKVPGDPCGTGRCAGGTVGCKPDGSGVVCAAPAAAIAEACNGEDDDCDGATDEGFVYDGGPYAADAGLTVGAPCGTGACAGGTVVCNGAVATCDTLSQATEEICNGADDDCDGELNEGLTDVTQSTCAQIGVCGAPGAVVAAACKQNTSGTWTCDYSGVPGYRSPEEGAGPAFCDGLDNDCDGLVDDAYDDLDGDGEADCVDDDIDGDGVLDGTGLPPCAPGQTTGCEDNCPYDANPGQADLDGDGVGDACAACEDACPACGSGCCTQDCGGDGASCKGDWCTSGCSCDIDCRGALFCDMDCNASDCRVDCSNAVECKLKCEGAGTCEFDMAGSNNTSADCKANTSCLIDCTGTNNCAANQCDPGASCLIDCTGANNCAFSVCGTGAVNCPGSDWVACNAECPQ